MGQHSRSRRWVAYGERALRKQIERRQAAYLWGQKLLHHAAPCELVFGDGETKLIHFASMNHRPNYYVVSIDSGIDVPGGDGHDISDDIVEAILDEYGDNDADNPRHKNPLYFPYWPQCSDGEHWGILSESWVERSVTKVDWAIFVLA